MGESLEIRVFGFTYYGLASRTKGEAETGVSEGGVKHRLCWPQLACGYISPSPYHFSPGRPGNTFTTMEKYMKPSRHKRRIGEPFVILVKHAYLSLTGHSHALIS